MTTLITGGASGLGEAITRKLASKGQKVFFTYCGSEARAKKIEEEYPATKAIHCDFLNESDVNGLLAQINEINPDVLINNAWMGTFIDQHFHKTEAAEFQKQFNNNLIPTIQITQAAINAFRKRKGGRIISILTSALVNKPPIGASVYVATKAYLRELSKVWATENSKFNISANTVSPSYMPTSFTWKMDERVVSQMKENHPLKKLLSPEEVAETVAFLATTSNHMNGMDIVLNAGMDIK